MKYVSYFIFLSLFTLANVQCSDDHDEPELDLSPKMLASDMDALRDIYSALDMGAEDYPVHWNLEDPSTWKGIELDTIVDRKKHKNDIVVKSMTLYLSRVGSELPDSLQNFSYLNELKVYGCTGSLFDGRKIPKEVTKLLVDRINPEDPGYIKGVHVVNPYRKEQLVVLLNVWTLYDEITIHGVDMAGIEFAWTSDAIIDLSYNTLSIASRNFIYDYLKSANLSHNRISSLDRGWDSWFSTMHGSQLGKLNLQYNDLDNIPEDILSRSTWRLYHKNFWGNPGYRPPKPVL